MTVDRPQQTIARTVDIKGVGFLSGAGIMLRFLPAPPNHGIVFQRVDCPGSFPIPARIEYTVPRERRTAIEYRGVGVEMIEHVMAALAGLQIDNCLVQLNGPEPPGCDGSAGAFVDCLCQTSIVPQGDGRQRFVIESPHAVADERSSSAIAAVGHEGDSLVITYELDYGCDSPIAPQMVMVEITPESFKHELAFARTFLLETEARALQEQGYGRHATAKDLLVFNAQGVIDNELRVKDECARHKALDCVGDFALLGCDLVGRVSAFRSGHHLNHELVRQLKSTQLESTRAAGRRAA